MISNTPNQYNRRVVLFAWWKKRVTDGNLILTEKQKISSRQFLQIEKNSEHLMLNGKKSGLNANGSAWEIRVNAISDKSAEPLFQYNIPF